MFRVFRQERGDPELMTRAPAALDDKLGRLALELGVLLDPDNQVTKEDLA
jgi:hypothetical protein